MKEIKAIVFCRVSTNLQDMEAQERACMKAALTDYNRNEITVVKKKESGVKLDEMHRESINQMKDIIAKNPSVETIYFFSIDRLARRVRVVIDVIDDLMKKGINCVFLNPSPLRTLNPDRTENAIAGMIISFMGKAAEMEAAMFKARVNNKKKELASVGKVAAGKVLYGYYKNEDRTISIKEEEAAVIRKLFNLYIENKMTVQDLNYELNKDDSNHFKAGTKGATTTRIMQIIKNYAYSGRNEKNAEKYNGNEKRNFTNVYPAIITPELQDKAIELASNKKTASKYHTKHSYYGKGLVRNASTGNLMTPHVSNMSYRSNPRDAEKVSIGLNIMDGLIKHLVYLYTPLLMEINISNDKTEYQDSINKNNKQIEGIQVEIGKYEANNVRVQRYLVRDKISESVADEQFDKNNNNIKLLNKKIAELKSEISRWNTIINNGIEKGETYFAIREQLRSGELDDTTIATYAKDVIKNITVTNINSTTKKIDVELNSVIADRITLKPYWISKKSFRPTLVQHNTDNDKGVDVSNWILKKYKRYC